MAIAARTIAAAWLCMQISTAHAIVVEWSGERFDLPVPGRMCPLSRSEPVDRQILEAQDRLNAGENIVLLAFAPCDELEEARTGRRQRLSQHGIWLLTAPDGKPAKVPSGTTRAEYARRLAGVVPKKDIDELVGTFGGRLAKEGITSTTKAMGQIHQSDSGVFMGILMSAASNGPGPDIAGVTGFTLAGTRPVTFNIYREYVDRETFDRLLMTASTMVDVLAGRLKPIDDPKDVAPALPAGMVTVGAGAKSSTDDLFADIPRSGAIDWSKVIDKGLAGALAGGVLAILIWIYRGLRRKE